MYNIYLITQGLIEKSDSIGYDLVFQYRLFKKWQMSPRIFAGQYKNNLYSDVPIENIDRLPVIIKEQPGLIVYHWVDGWKEIDELISTLSSPVIIRWHNNTPPWFFAPYSTERASRTTRGFKSIVKMIENPNIKFWVNSEFTKCQLEILGAPSNRINVIYPASHFIENDIEDNLVIDKPKDDNIRLLFVGRVTPHKGFHHVMFVVYILQKWLNRKVEIYFSGRPDEQMPKYLQQLNTLAQNLKLSVHFLGEIGLSELDNLYKTSHVYITLSEHEGFGLPIIEAMRRKLPVIGYRSTAVANLLKDHPLACDKLDYFDIAKKLGVVVTSDEARSAILRYQTDIILPRFSRDIIENQLSLTLGRVQNNSHEEISVDNSCIDIINRELKKLENIPMPIIFLPFSYKDYPNNYMTNYDILAYDTLLGDCYGKSSEEIDLFDEAMKTRFSSHRRILGPSIIQIKRIILYLQDGVIKTISKANARTDQKLASIDSKLERLIQEHVKSSNEDKSATINLISSLYDRNYFEGKKTKSNYDSYSRDAYLPGENLAKTLLEIFKPDSYLDVGCALGFVVKYMKKYGVDSHGIDISEYAVKQANVDFIKQLDISREDLNEKYDVVTAFDILEHIPERLLPYTINNLWQATKKYLIVVPAYYDEGTIYDPGDSLHVVFHPKIWWENLFKSCGISLDIEMTERLNKSEYAKTYGYTERFIVGIRKS